MSDRTRSATASQILHQVLDPGSFESWCDPVDISGHPPEYQRVLRAAAEKAGSDEAVLTGSGRVNGRPVAVIVNEFGFLGGSIGVAAAGRIVAAVRRATAQRLPVLAATASGGTRMQEGTPAFLQMVTISRAIVAHRAAGLPYLVYLRHPTTGGVYASWGSLGHVVVAEPGALIGFLGPKVVEALNGRAIPSGVQVAENLAAKGVIDGVVPPRDIPVLVERALRVLVDPPTPPALPRRGGVVRSGGSAWDSIMRTREPGRAGVRELLRYGSSETLRLNGTDEGERDESMLIALARLDGQPCVVIGQDRSRQNDRRRLGPAALRVARRAMSLAEELQLPLLAVIDTPGAELSADAEEGALAGEIARCMAQLTQLRTATLSLILGQGCGGAALALLPARRVIATEHAWLTPLPPEGASVIVHGDVDHAAEVAEAQHVRAVDLHAEGAISAVVPEYDSDSARDLALAVAAECAAHLYEMTRQRPMTGR